MRSRSLLVAIPLLVLAACARGSVQDAPAPAASSTALPGSARANAGTLTRDEAERELALAEKQLGDALALAAPDCDVARTLRDRICDLSARICSLTEATADGTVKEQCEDGKRRCGHARDAVGARC